MSHSLKVVLTGLSLLVSSLHADSDWKDKFAQNSSYTIVVDKEDPALVVIHYNLLPNREKQEKLIAKAGSAYSNADSAALK